LKSFSRFEDFNKMYNHCNTLVYQYFMRTWPDVLKIALSLRIRNLKTHNKRRMMNSRWLRRENEENVARKRNFWGWPSSPHPIVQKKLWFQHFLQVWDASLRWYIYIESLCVHLYYSIVISNNLYNMHSIHSFNILR